MVTYGGFTVEQLIPAVVGGLIISAGITINLWFNDRFTSLTALVTGFIGGETSDSGRKGAVVAGMVAASALIWNLFGYGQIKGTTVVPFDSEASFISGLGLYGFIVSGLLVGLGSTIAGGGISRFAFCGLPSTSYKSGIAVAAFLGAGFATATFKHNISFLSSGDMSSALLHIDPRLTVNIFLGFAVAVVVLNFLSSPSSLMTLLFSVASGALISVGYMVSGLSHRFLVLQFLTFQSGWSPIMLVSILAVVAANFLTFNIILGKNMRSADAHTNFINVVVGSGIFGMGLGLSGLTPGTALVVAPVYFPEVLVFFMIPVIFGSQLAGSVTKVLSVIGAANERSEAYALF